MRARRADEVTVGSLNLHRLSSSAEDYVTRLSKLSLYIREVLLSPDILGVQEVRSIAELSDLADVIRTDTPSVDYRAHLASSSSDIEVGFLVRSRVQVVELKQYGTDEAFVDPTDLSIDRLHDRPPFLLHAVIEKLRFRYWCFTTDRSWRRTRPRASVANGSNRRSPWRVWCSRCRARS